MRVECNCVSLNSRYGLAGACNEVCKDRLVPGYVQEMVAFSFCYLIRYNVEFFLLLPNHRSIFPEKSSEKHLL